MNHTITCPNCGHAFLIEEFISKQVKDVFEKEMAQERARLQDQQAKEMQTLREKIEADVRQQADKQACEKYEILLTQERVKIQRLEKAAQEMQKKAQPTSQELQGEAQEIAIEGYLRKNFPLDSIEEVKKGHRGPDCMQVVNDYKLQGCGVICYESKRTKDFKKEWIEKLKQDMQEHGAQVGVLVTQLRRKAPSFS
ncbi:DUF2130 domain-containing protein [Helicobacter suis]|uniref:DUF2130 domain-containing protein n=1 Tax=Helicobacter suis TaxID=104628 RepID=UPI001F072D7E|nr:DUF2130 domain-containing protein [Helicobacter suis]